MGDASIPSSALERVSLAAALLGELVYNVLMIAPVLTDFFILP